jgi:uncharacterized repeat protein (TIGR01451 family)
MKDSTDPVTETSVLGYNITVTNTGPIDATNVTVISDIPANLALLMMSNQCNMAAATISCNVGNLTSGASKSVQLVFTPSHAAVGTIVSNTASAVCPELPAPVSVTEGTLVIGLTLNTLSPEQIYFDANNNVGMGTFTPVFNDDGGTGAHVGKFVAIDGGVSGASAYLGLGGTVPGVFDRVGVLNFYNWSIGGVDYRTAIILSANDGELGKGNLSFYTSPSTVGPVERLRIASDGTIRIGNPFVAGGTLGVSALPGEALIQSWSANGLPVVSVLTNGKVYIRGAGVPLIMKAPNGQCFEKSIDNSGNWVTTPVTPCPP